MKHKREKRPENFDSPEWQLYQKLRGRYEAVKALIDLSSEVGRLPDGPPKDGLKSELDLALSMREVEDHTKSKCDSLGSDAKPPPYKKYLAKANK